MSVTFGSQKLEDGSQKLKVGIAFSLRSSSLYFLNSILKHVTCHSGSLTGFFIISASLPCDHLSLTSLPSIFTEVTGFP
jgi:hypothetical protein